MTALLYYHAFHPLSTLFFNFLESVVWAVFHAVLRALLIPALILLILPLIYTLYMGKGLPDKRHMIK